MSSATTTRRSTKRLGQGMTEYILMVGMVSVLLVGAVKGLGASAGKAFEKTTSGIQQVAEMVEKGGDDAAPSTKSPGSTGLISGEEDEPLDEELSLPDHITTPR